MERTARVETGLTQPDAKPVFRKIVRNKPRATRKIRLVIADANLMACHLLAQALERQPHLHVIASVVDNAGLLNSLCDAKPDIVLISAHLQDGHLAGFAKLQEIRNRFPDLPFIMLLDRSESQLVLDAFRAGARGVFARSESQMKLLCKCIQRVVEGQIWADNRQLEYVMEAFSSSEASDAAQSRMRPLSLLTAREEVVVRLVAEGMGNREIAKELKLSEHTVKNYLFRIFEKLGFSNRVELVLYAMARLNQSESVKSEASLTKGQMDAGISSAVSAD